MFQSIIMTWLFHNTTVGEAQSDAHVAVAEQAAGFAFPVELGRIWQVILVLRTTNVSPSHLQLRLRLRPGRQRGCN
jgi:hypothetical protein